MPDYVREYLNNVGVEEDFLNNAQKIHHKGNDLQAWLYYNSDCLFLKRHYWDLNVSHQTRKYSFVPFTNLAKIV